MGIRVKLLAEKILRKYKNKSLREILNIRNVIVIDSMPLISVKGFYQYIQRNNIIYIDCNLKPLEAKFVLAHEFGHMLMHKGQNAMFLDSRGISSLDKYECQANSFAVEFLLPDRYLRENQEYGIYTLARIRGVPEEFVKLKYRGL